ncbi:TnsA-like heteromeric transposase endonuclease subunit [Streptomyces sp. NPDC058268]|uniref:TnsA-like heteromeric transposase endonuclease subunit n=1 Tax=Streptomyces sp. NPDC058268 TaxID=3346413 RepID=UPI0036DFC642
MAPSVTTVHVRRRVDGEVAERPWAEVSVDLLRVAEPWRTFRWYKEQKHYSGIYWAATTRDHVIYESRLELTRLLFADFDPSVQHIVAQPFLLKSVVGGKERKHIPDYLLITDQGPVVVDVKPLRRLAKPEVAFTFDWTRQEVESRGWRYEVWSEPSPELLENIRFLAGYRRDWLFSSDLLDELRSSELDGVALSSSARMLPARSEPEVKAAIYHLLWIHHLTVDLEHPLSPSHVVRTRS